MEQATSLKSEVCVVENTDPQIAELPAGALDHVGGGVVVFDL